MIAGTAIAILASGASKADEYCREYTSAVGIGGQRESSYGTACLQPDGAWKITSPNYNENYNDNNNYYNRNDVRYEVKEKRIYVMAAPVIYRPSYYRWHHDNGHHHGHKKHKHNNHGRNW